MDAYWDARMAGERGDAMAAQLAASMVRLQVALTAACSDDSMGDTLAGG